MGIKKFFNEEEKNKILQAIKDAEDNTSGEIRLHLDSKCKGDALAQGIKIFQRLKMHKTALRNGTLIFLAVDDKKFAIVGDEGINKIVDENFWDDVRDIMQAAFKKNEFVPGIVSAILRIGEKLKEFFPHQEDDVNELPDEISMGE